MPIVEFRFTLRMYKILLLPLSLDGPLFTLDGPLFTASMCVSKRVEGLYHGGYMVCYCAKNIYGDPLSLQGNCKIWQARLAGTVVGWALALLLPKGML